VKDRCSALYPVVDDLSLMARRLADIRDVKGDSRDFHA
jgi:hypothetical protein